MNYDEAIGFLESFIDYEKIGGSYYTPERVTLKSIRRLLELMGNPEKELAYVHIAGTKGKGSTAAMTASILTSAGLRTGLYTSPHLVDFRERIQIDGRMIPMEVCAARVTEMADAALAVKADDTVGELSFFEVYTALAFHYFEKEGCDIVVLEPGLGGRLDATNVVTPVVCGITLIGHDHEAILGDTLDRIAAEKAGILKSGVPVIVAPQMPEAEAVIEHCASSASAPAYWLRQQSGKQESPHPPPVFHPMEYRAGKATFSLKGLLRDYPLLSSPLLGRHQITNAAMAVCLAEAASRGRFELSPEAVEEGLRRTHWPGRFQIIDRDPIVVLDGAHNPESAVALRKTLEDHLRYDRLFVVFGGMGDHNLQAVARELFPLAERVVLTRADNPRAAPVDRLRELTRDLCPRMESAERVADALVRARSLAGPSDAILVTGSLYVVGEILAQNPPFC